jgi:hypothetical protein
MVRLFYAEAGDGNMCKRKVKRQKELQDSLIQLEDQMNPCRRLVRPV